MPIDCRCITTTSEPDLFPPTFDTTSCPTHGPDAPRYFVDHETVHDRVTGKHVELDEIVALLNDVAASSSTSRGRK